VSNTVYLIRLRLLVWNTAQGWAEKRALDWTEDNNIAGLNEDGEL